MSIKSIITKNFNLKKKIVLMALVFMWVNHIKAQKNELLNAKLFASLPDYCPTPDAFDIAPDGSLTLSCPNFADRTKPGVLMRISKVGGVTKLAEMPVLESSGMSKPMGIAYDNDGILYVCDNQTNKGRLLRMTFNKSQLISTEVVAYGFNSINGVRYYKDYLYITQTKMPKLKKEKTVGGVYRFKITDRNIKVHNNKLDKNLIYTSITQNPERQVGLDGLVFNKKGELFVGNLGDAIIYKLILNTTGKVVKEEVYAKLPINSAPDGIHIDDTGNLYVAGFARNQIFKIDTHKKVELLVEYPDNNGANGELDQPADVIVYNGKLIISNFDLMTGKGMLNSKHDKPYTISYIDLNK